MEIDIGWKLSGPRIWTRVGKTFNLAMSLLPLRIIVGERLAPVTIDKLLRERVILGIDAFRGHLVSEVVFKFVFKTDFFSVRSNATTCIMGQLFLEPLTVFKIRITSEDVCHP